MYAAIEGTKPGAETDYLPGVANAGLFATHELRHGVRAAFGLALGVRDGGAAAAAAAGGADRGARLHRPVGRRARADPAVPMGSPLARSRCLLDEHESFDGDSSRFSVSPVAYAVSIAQKHELSWVMILRGSQLRALSSASGARGWSQGSCRNVLRDRPRACHRRVGGVPARWCSRRRRSPARVRPPEILASSAQYAVALGERLRDQVYEQIVPALSLAIAAQLAGARAPARPATASTSPTGSRFASSSAFCSRRTPRIASCCPFGENPRYDRNALNTLARDLASTPTRSSTPNSASMWDDLAQVWHVSTRATRPGRCRPTTAAFRLRPRAPTRGRAARADQRHERRDGAGVASDADRHRPRMSPARSTSARSAFASSERSTRVCSSRTSRRRHRPRPRRQRHLGARQGRRRSARPERSAPAGSVYFHNTCGQRKGTGSYFTPSFVVEHLLERALDPALEEHLARVKETLDAGDQAGAADLFFDFRVADLAMGSGHFLTAAIDHLEAGMAAFLAENPIPGVTNELRHLEQAAREAVGPDAPRPGAVVAAAPPDRPPLHLRTRHQPDRRRARPRLDLDSHLRPRPPDVEPRSQPRLRQQPHRDRHRRRGARRARARAGEGMAGTTTIFDAPIRGGARSSEGHARRRRQRGRSDAEGSPGCCSRHHGKAQAEAGEAKLLFDAAVLQTDRPGALVAAVEPDRDRPPRGVATAQELLRRFAPAHMPVLFPEVFLRDGGGFDVLVGNPPWEKLKVEEHQWWGFAVSRAPRHCHSVKRMRASPNIRRETRSRARVRRGQYRESSLKRQVIGAGPFHTRVRRSDLYQAFAWRNWQLLRAGVALE